jgi:hypothetical protein
MTLGYILLTIIVSKKEKEANEKYKEEMEQKRKTFNLVVESLIIFP